MRPRRVWRALGLLMTATLIGGCGLLGGSGGTGVAEGFTRVSPARISFAYPEDWKEADKTAKGWVFKARAVADGEP